MTLIFFTVHICFICDISVQISGDLRETNCVLSVSDCAFVVKNVPQSFAEVRKVSQRVNDGVSLRKLSLTECKIPSSNRYPTNIFDV